MQKYRCFFLPARVNKQPHRLPLTDKSPADISGIKKLIFIVMETKISLLTEKNLTYHFKNYNLIGYEREVIQELLTAVEKDDHKVINWFSQFGDSIRTIIFNVYAYRMGLRFGFTEIEFDDYNWLKRPTFLDLEELRFGLDDKVRYGNYSTITVGRGKNQAWTYGLSASYGTAGSSSGICVYDPVFASKEEALRNAVDQLKNMMLPKVGDKDTTNYNQQIILATIRDIDAYEVRKVQLTLF
jgi:hypothetical protein